MGDGLTGEERRRVRQIRADGTVENGGSCRFDGHQYDDFRDEHGLPWPLPPGAEFSIEIPEEEAARVAFHGVIGTAKTLDGEPVETRTSRLEGEWRE